MWTFPQHTIYIEQFHSILKIIHNNSGDVLNKKTGYSILKELEKANVYKPRGNKKGQKTSIRHKLVLTPEFFWASYELDGSIFLTPYGNLLLKHWDNFEERSKVFTSMLFANQFPNPAKEEVPSDVKIFPFRLIFKLLSDDRLNGELNNVEIAFILYKVKEINKMSEYEKILEDIINFRKLSKEKIKKEIEKEPSLTDDFVKSYVSINYTFGVLKEMAIITEERDDVICRVKSPKRKDETPVRLRTMKLKEEIKPFINMMLKKYKVNDRVLEPKGLKSQWIREIYSKIYPELIENLGYGSDGYTEILELPYKIIDSSRDSSNSDRFEGFINKAFNLFSDVEAEVIGGSGDTDVLCVYTDKENNLNKFIADAKSTKTQLSSVPSGRIRDHMSKNNGKFALVITPKFSPGCLRDIKDFDINLLDAHTFSDLIGKYVLKKYENREDCSFEKVYEIISKNKSIDISQKINKLIKDETGINYNKLATLL